MASYFFSKPSYTELESQLRDANAEIALAWKRSGEAIDRLEEERTRLVEKNERLLEENEKLLEENHNLIAENEDLQIVCQDMVKEKEELRQEKMREQALGKAAMGATNQLQQKMDIQKQKYRELYHEESLLRGEKEALEAFHSEEIGKRRRLESDIQLLETRLENKTQQAIDLQEKVGMLENEASTQERLKPLIEIGAAVRLRYLQQARVMITGEGQKQFWVQKAIDEGNAAAHRANGSADSSLLTSQFVSEAEGNSLSLVFKDLYKEDPYDYGQLPTQLAEALDCEATIRTTVFLKKKNGIFSHASAGS